MLRSRALRGDVGTDVASSGIDEQHHRSLADGVIYSHDDFNYVEQEVGGEKYCLENTDGALVVTMNTCDALGANGHIGVGRWALDTNTGLLKTEYNSDNCLDAATPSNAFMMPCNENRQTQKWIYDSNTQMLKVRDPIGIDKCLHGVGYPTPGKIPIAIAPCQASNHNQKFQVMFEPPTTLPSPLP